MKLNKSKLGVFFSGLFLMSTAVSSYATDVHASEAAVTGSVSESIELIQTADFAEISFDITDPEVSAAKDLVIAADDDENVTTDNVHVALFQFAMCLSNNNPGTTGTDTGAAGVDITFNAATDMEDGVYKYRETHDSQVIMTLFGTTHKNHIRTLALMQPAGGTYDSTLFGSGAEDEATGQVAGIEFMFGGPGATSSATTISLNDAGNGSLVSPEQSYANVAIGTQAKVNHYGRNPSLDTSDVLHTAGAVSSKGLTPSSEMRTLSNCLLNQDPTDDDATPTTALTYVTVYANARDVAAAMADTYTMKFNMDIEDSSEGGISTAGL